MFRLMKNWMHRYFSEEEAIVLILLLAAVLLVVVSFGSVLAPMFVGLGFAFILQGVVNYLEKRKVPHLLAVSLVFSLFVTLACTIILLIIPLIWKQGSNLFNELPGMFTTGYDRLHGLPQLYPGLISETQVSQWIESANQEISYLGQWLLSFSISKLPNLVGIMIYLILVPIFVFFFLKDKALLLNWLSDRLPRERRMINQVTEEMNRQISNYIRGKVIEILAVGAVTYIAFIYFNLNYALLLALLVGLSVIIPYIGATLVTIPVAAVGLFQFGFDNHFLLLMAVYGVIQAIDGNILVPLLFGEAVNLHPTAIIIAVLFFGGVWGVWGVFFAIPLATLIRAIVTAWPQQPVPATEPQEKGVCH